jgi:hypothetical protein
MNNKILQKCVDELKKESPKIDYVLGMLESVIELGGSSSLPHLPSILDVKSIPRTDSVSDEEGSGLLARYEKGTIGNI